MTYSAPLSLVDADVHNFVETSELLPYLPAYWRDFLKLRGRPVPPPLHVSPIGFNRGDAVPPGGGMAGSDPQHVLEHHFDAYDIQFGVLNGSSILGISLNGDPDLGNVVASAYNDVLVEKWLAHSPRFGGSLLVNHADPLGAAREIERLGTHPQIVQIIMASGSNCLFGQRFFHPIYEAAHALNLPVAIHPGTEGVGTAFPATPAGHPTRYMEWHNILPLNYMGHINSLVCEGVFEKFPGLQFVAIEGGISWMAHLMWRMDKNFKALRSTTPWLKKLPSEYIREGVFLTTQPIEEPENPRHLTQIIEMIRLENNVLFSSDYPHWDFDNPKMALPPMERELKAKILWQNAARLYRLPRENPGETPVLLRENQNGLPREVLA